MVPGWFIDYRHTFIHRSSPLAPYLASTEAELLEEEAELNQGSGEAGKMGGLRRRRRAYSRTMQEHVKPKGQYGQNTEQHRDGNSGTPSVLHIKLENSINYRPGVHHSQFNLTAAAGSVVFD